MKRQPFKCTSLEIPVSTDPSILILILNFADAALKNLVLSKWSLHSFVCVHRSLNSNKIVIGDICTLLRKRDAPSTL